MAEQEVDDVTDTALLRDGGEVEPETSAVLQSILEEARSEDETTRILALRHLNNILHIEESKGSRIHVAAFILERGFLKTITGGLEECVSGPWVILPPRTGDRIRRFELEGDFPVVWKPTVYLEAFAGLSADGRTVRYILKHSPRLLSAVKAIFQRAHECTDRSLKLLTSQIMDIVTLKLPRICTANSTVCKKIGQSTQFLSAVMQHAATMELSGEQAGMKIATLHSAVCLLRNVRPFIDAAFLEEDILQFAAKVLSVSSDKVPIVWTVDLLRKLASGRKLTPEGWPLALRGYAAALKSPILALALCPNILSIEDYALVVNIAACLKPALPFFSGPLDGCDPWKLLLELGEVALKDPVAKRRAEELREIFNSTTGGTWAVYFRNNTDASAKSRILERSQKIGVGRVTKTIAARKWSRPGCEKAEARV